MHIFDLLYPLCIQKTRNRILTLFSSTNFTFITILHHFPTKNRIAISFLQKLEHIKVESSKLPVFFFMKVLYLNSLILLT